MALAMGARTLREVEKESRRKQATEDAALKMLKYRGSTAKSLAPVGKAGPSPKAGNGPGGEGVRARVAALQSGGGGHGPADLQL